MGYSQAIGLPWSIPCTFHECVVAGFDASSGLLALIAAGAWAWGHVKRPWLRLLLGNLVYFVTGALLVLVAVGFVSTESDGYSVFLGVICLAAGVAALLAGIRRFRSRRTWVEEASRGDWKAVSVAFLGFLLAAAVAVELVVSDLAERTYSGDLEGTPLDASIAGVFVMKDKDSALHGREVQIVVNAEGKFYAYDFSGPCPSPGHMTEGALCLFVVMESEVESIEFLKVWS